MMNMRFAALACLLTLGIASAEWGAPAAVHHMNETCLTYHAKLAGDYLIVEANISEGWHTFAMDNELRAKEALAGKQSLGIDGPTQIELVSGLEAAGPWLQTPPKDFSRPELRWYSWGFEDHAVFAAKVKKTGGPAKIAVKGQTCSDSTCKNVDLELNAPADESKADVSGLEPVRHGS